MKVGRLQRPGREPERRQQQEELRRAGHGRRDARRSTSAAPGSPTTASPTVAGVADSASPTTPGTSTPSTASRATKGLYVLGEYLRGTDATSSKNTIQGIQGVAAYNYRLKSPTSWLYAIEPAFRIDLADPNTDVDNDRSTLITAVLGFYMSSKAQFRVAYERQSFQGSNVPSISGVRSALTVSF